MAAWRGPALPAARWETPAGSGICFLFRSAAATAQPGRCALLVRKNTVQEAPSAAGSRRQPENEILNPAGVC